MAELRKRLRFFCAKPLMNVVLEHNEQFKKKSNFAQSEINVKRNLPER